MNDKDKSFFAKIILASVVFVAFLTVLGLTAELVRNKKVVNSEPVVLISPIVVENEYFGNEFIQLKLPQKNTVIKSPVLISGKANVFEGNVRVRIKDKNENILTDTFITASGAYDKLYPFEGEIHYIAPAFQSGVVEIFTEDMKDGGEINKIVIPITFEDYIDISTWKTYRNEKYGFELQYPRSLILSENDKYKGENDQLLDKVLLGLNKISNDNFLTVNRFEIGKNETFKDIIEKNSWLPGGGTRHADFTKFKSVKIGDSSYYYRYFCGDPSGSIEDGNEACGFFYYYWLVKGQSVYEFELFDVISTNDTKVDFENSLANLEFKNILSTFKFTN